MEAKKSRVTEAGFKGTGKGEVMVQYLEKEEKQRCRELWEEAFLEDSREFCDYYFREKLKDNRILALVQDGQVDAMLHRNPYSIAAKGRCWQVDYLVGVATRKEKRHRGYMRRLLLKAMKDMQQEKMPFCFLMPAAEAIYRPFGFVYICRQPKFERGTGWGEESRQPVSGLIPWKDTDEYETRLNLAAEWMDSWLQKHYQLYTKRDRDYVRRLVDEIASENGTLDILYDREKIAALSSMWGRTEPEQRLLYGDAPYVKRVDGQEKPAIMARIISLEVFMKVICLKEDAGCSENCVVRLQIRDTLIPENDGMWLWHLERGGSWMERPEQEKNDFVPELSLTIEELTAWLFGYETPEAAGNYESLAEPLQGVFLDEVV